MQSKMCGNEYRTFIVCVDAYEDKNIKGRIYNPFLNGGVAFENLMQFVLQMEQLLDQMHFPQAFVETRSFTHGRQPSPEPDSISGPRQGASATFSIRVLFRQNASWQGTISWLEGGQEEGFRSLLELLLLMDSALSPARQKK